MKLKIIFFLLKNILNVKSINIINIDYDTFTLDYVLKTIKDNQFVEINKRGNFYLKGFTLLEIVIKNVIIENKEKKIIESINIMHDIDSVINRKVSGILIRSKVIDLQMLINYFNKI